MLITYVLMNGWMVKIPKGYSESVNQRRPDNRMAKKRTNLQNMHIKLKM
jgi:hypothetical protein